MDRDTILKKHWYHFLSPKYWLLWIGFGLLRLSVFLPYTVMIFLGKKLGRFLMFIIPSRKHIAKINIDLCFPELTPDERKKLLISHFESIGIGIFETGLAWWASDETLKKMCDLIGTENHKNASKKGKGILVVTYHATCIELAIRLYSLFAKVNVMYRPQKNKLAEWMLQKARKKYVRTGVTRKDIRSMLRCLKETDALMCYTPDQDLGKQSTVFAPFFGISASTVIGTNYLAKKTACAIIPGFYCRKGKKYTITFLPLLENFPTDNDISDATRINQLIEIAIRKHPEQYMWTHRRFKTRPDESKKGSIYKNNS